MIRADYCTVSFIERLEDRRLLAADLRSVVDLDPGWRFKKSDVTDAQKTSFNDSSWSGVSLPHTWNASDGQDGGDNYYRGVGWYRRHLTLDSSFSGKELFLEFGAASIVADVYVNGASIGEHRGAFGAFTYDVTSQLKVGQDNVIAVKVNNADNQNVAPIETSVVTNGPDFTIFGGLYRDVHLIATSKSHVTLTDFSSPGVFLTPSSVSSSSADLNVKAEVINDGTSSRTLKIIADVYDANGSLVTETKSNGVSIKAGATYTFSQDTTIQNPHLWNGTSDPYLYKTTVTVVDGSTVTDSVTQPLGLRSFRIDAKNGFFLNGTYLDLHGVAYHQDEIGKGWAKSDADTDRDVSLMQEMGVNYVRLTHYEHAEHTYDDLDKAGIVAWSEIPYIYDQTNSSSFQDNLKDQLRELIRQNYNHPSIFFWGLFNGINSDSKPVALLTQLNSLAHQEDPTRLTTGAWTNRTGPDAQINFVTDVTAYNDYFGWYRGVFSDAGPYLDAFHDDHGNTPLAISEYGAGASIYQHEQSPTSVDDESSYHPEEYQDLFHEAQWRQLRDRPYIWAKTVFSMFDFAVDARSEGDTDGRNDKGLVTYDRQTKKDSFYFYKSNWTNTPTVYITSRGYTNRPSSNVEVKIYSNLDSVTLKVNGQTIGTSNGDSIDVFKWSNVKLRGGANTIEAVGTMSGQTYSDSVVWTAPGGSATNQPPTVDAGPDLAIAQPNTALLDATVNDDGLPSNSVVTTWSRVSGPGSVTFANASAVDTSAGFSADGTYVLRLTANDGQLSSSDDLTVTVGPPATGQAVASLTLINADTDQVVAGFDSIPNNATFDFSAIGTTHLSIRANTSPSVVGSVRFALDGNANFSTENQAPYGIAGDSNGIDYFAWTPSIGSHALTVTPYTASDGGGTAGSTFTLNFTVTNGATSGSKVIGAAADTFLRGGTKGNQNFGAAGDLEVKQASSANDVRNALLKFDLSGIASVASGQSVILRLFGDITGSRNTNLTTDVYSAATSWQESSVTWNSKPAAGSKIASQTITDAVGRWYQWDITAYARSELAAGRSTIALLLKNVQNSSDVVAFNSRESGVNQPQLLVSG